MILALDPSSTCTGYAVFGGSGGLTEAGYLKPTRTKDPWIERVMVMRNELLGLMTKVFDDVIIEVPSGKVGTGQRRGAGAALSIYGFAAGALWTAAFGLSNVHAITEREWTRAVPKKIRQSRIAAEFPAYRDVLSKDAGGDVSDAIGIGLWWFQRIKGGAFKNPRPDRRIECADHDDAAAQRRVSTYASGTRAQRISA